MKAFKLAVGAGLLVASTAAFAAYTPAAGITGTPHDWSAPTVTNPTTGAITGGTALLQWLVDPTKPASGSNITTYNTGNVYTDPATGKQGVVRVQFGLCTKCHTPHQAKSTNLLWNHTLTTNTYSWDQPATTAGTIYPTFKGDKYKGSTTKCLSCHDGSLASTDGVWFNRQEVSGSKYVAPAGSLDSGHEVASSTGNMSGTHPVAMPYPLGNASNTYNGTFNGAQTIWAEFVADPTSAGVRLFNDDGLGNITAGAVGGKTGMECSSCHDVHNGSRTKDQLLLTGKLSGGISDGYICTQCHKK